MVSSLLEESAPQHASLLRFARDCITLVDRTPGNPTKQLIAKMRSTRSVSQADYFRARQTLVAVMLGLDIHKAAVMVGMDPDSSIVLALQAMIHHANDLVVPHGCPGQSGCIQALEDLEARSVAQLAAAAGRGSGSATQGSVSPRSGGAVESDPSAAHDEIPQAGWYQGVEEIDEELHPIAGQRREHDSEKIGGYPVEAPISSPSVLNRPPPAKIPSRAAMHAQMAKATASKQERPRLHHGDSSMVKLFRQAHPAAWLAAGAAVIASVLFLVQRAADADVQKRAAAISKKVARIAGAPRKNKRKAKGVVPAGPPAPIAADQAPPSSNTKNKGPLEPVELQESEPLKEQPKLTPTSPPVCPTAAIAEPPAGTLDLEMPQKSAGTPKRKGKTARRRRRQNSVNSTASGRSSVAGTPVPPTPPAVPSSGDSDFPTEFTLSSASDQVAKVHHLQKMRQIPHGGAAGAADAGSSVLQTLQERPGAGASSSKPQGSGWETVAPGGRHSNSGSVASTEALGNVGTPMSGAVGISQGEDKSPPASPQPVGIAESKGSHFVPRTASSSLASSSVCSTASQSRRTSGAASDVHASVYSRNSSEAVKGGAAKEQHGGALPAVRPHSAPKGTPERPTEFGQADSEGNFPVAKTKQAHNAPSNTPGQSGADSSGAEAGGATPLGMAPAKPSSARKSKAKQKKKAHKATEDSTNENVAALQALLTQATVTDSVTKSSLSRSSAGSAVDGTLAAQATTIPGLKDSHIHAGEVQTKKPPGGQQGLLPLPGAAQGVLKTPPAPAVQASVESETPSLSLSSMDGIVAVSIDSGSTACSPTVEAVSGCYADAAAAPTAIAAPMSTVLPAEQGSQRMLMLYQDHIYCMQNGSYGVGWYRIGTSADTDLVAEYLTQQQQTQAAAEQHNMLQAATAQSLQNFSTAAAVAAGTWHSGDTGSVPLGLPGAVNSSLHVGGPTNGSASTPSKARAGVHALSPSGPINIPLPGGATLNIGLSSVSSSSSLDSRPQPASLTVNTTGSLVPPPRMKGSSSLHNLSQSPAASAASVAAAATLQAAMTRGQYAVTGALSHSSQYSPHGMSGQSMMSPMQLYHQHLQISQMQAQTAGLQRSRSGHMLHTAAAPAHVPQLQAAQHASGFDAAVGTGKGELRTARGNSVTSDISRRSSTGSRGGTSVNKVAKKVIGLLPVPRDPRQVPMSTGPYGPPRAQRSSESSSSSRFAHAAQNDLQQAYSNMRHGQEPMRAHAMLPHMNSPFVMKPQLASLPTAGSGARGPASKKPAHNSRRQKHTDPKDPIIH